MVIRFYFILFILFIILTYLSCSALVSCLRTRPRSLHARAFSLLPGFCIGFRRRYLALSCWLWFVCVCLTRWPRSVVIFNTLSQLLFTWPYALYENMSTSVEHTCVMGQVLQSAGSLWGAPELFGSSLVVASSGHSLDVCCLSWISVKGMDLNVAYM